MSISSWIWIRYGWRRNDKGAEAPRCRLGCSVDYAVLVPLLPIFPMTSAPRRSVSSRRCAYRCVINGDLCVINRCKVYRSTSPDDARWEAMPMGVK